LGIVRQGIRRTPYRQFDTVYGAMSEQTEKIPALAGVAAVVVLGAVMSILDTTVVNVAIDALGRDLGAPLATIQWVATGYMLALATVIPVTGWAADRFGTARLFVVAVSLFTAGSALAGLAWSAESLIAFRFLQGLGGGMILPAGITLVGQAAGPQRMGRTMSVIGIPMLLAPMAGPVLGGWLVDAVSWRWIFFVNLPVGALVLVLAARLLPRDPAPQPSQPLDWRGLLLLSPGLAAFVYGLAETSARGGIGSTRALVPMAAGAALIAAFVVHALRTSAAPLLDLRLLQIRAVAASAATLLLLGGAFLGTLFLLPLYLQVARGESALHAGLLLLPQGAGAALAMSVAGRVADRSGAGRVVLAGLVPFALALAALTRLGTDTSYVALTAILLLFGVGMGATMMPAMTAAFRTIERAQVARATALLTIVQRIGSSIGVALVAVVLSSGLRDLPPAAGAPRPEQLADAFAQTFRWPLLLVLLAFVPAAALARLRR
jgi:EmrB/QacA subfamily drug resistance transporter